MRGWFRKRVAGEVIVDDKKGEWSLCTFDFYLVFISLSPYTVYLSIGDALMRNKTEETHEEFAECFVRVVNIDFILCYLINFFEGRRFLIVVAKK